MTRPKPQNREYSTDWFADLESTDDKELRKKLISSAAPVLEILGNILKKRLASIDRRTKYEDHWEFNIPKDLGRREELELAIKLVTPVNKE